MGGHGGGAGAAGKGGGRGERGGKGARGVRGERGPGPEPETHHVVGGGRGCMKTLLRNGTG